MAKQDEFWSKEDERAYQAKLAQRPAKLESPFTREEFAAYLVASRAWWATLTPAERWRANSEREAIVI